MPYLQSAFYKYVLCGNNNVSFGSTSTLAPSAFPSSAAASAASSDPDPAATCWEFQMRFLLMSNINARCLAFAFAFALWAVVNKRSICDSERGEGSRAEGWSCDRTSASACIAFDMRRAIAIADLCLSHKQIELSQQQQQQQQKQ